MYKLSFDLEIFLENSDESLHKYEFIQNLNYFDRPLMNI